MIRRPVICAWLTAIVLCGCGATPPQAPLPDAMKLDSGTSGISTSCGLAYQVTAFPGNHSDDLATLESTATTAAGKVALVYSRNPAWIYQGETVRQIVAQSLSMLSSCGLHRSAAALLRETSR